MAKTYDMNRLSPSLHRRAMTELSCLDKDQVDRLGRINPAPGSDVDREVKGWYRAAHQFITYAKHRMVVSTAGLGSTHELCVREKLGRIFKDQDEINREEAEADE